MTTVCNIYVYIYIKKIKQDFGDKTVLAKNKNDKEYEYHHHKRQEICSYT
jgi:uncharacterized ion transporter superfamily protein YfcC